MAISPGWHHMPVPEPFRLNPLQQHAGMQIMQAKTAQQQAGMQTIYATKLMP